MAKGNDAERLLLDPAYQEATKQLRESLVKQLEDMALDGSEKASAQATEIVRLLQTAKRYQRLLWAMVDGEKLTADKLERKSRYKAAGL